MVWRASKNGRGWHEPPYTKAEVDELYRRWDQGISEGKLRFTRPEPPRAPAPQAPTAEQASPSAAPRPASEPHPGGNEFDAAAPTSAQGQEPPSAEPRPAPTPRTDR
jgi:hypothetical protein